MIRADAPMAVGVTAMLFNRSAVLCSGHRTLQQRYAGSYAAAVQRCAMVMQLYIDIRVIVYGLQASPYTRNRNKEPLVRPPTNSQAPASCAASRS